MSQKKRFKLSFGGIEIAGLGLNGKQRALIIAVSQIPGVQGWLNAVLAVEDGSMQVKAITQIDFDLSQHNLVALVEVEGERAAPVLYTPDGKPAAAG
jgi:hypothetical protein